MPSSPLLFGTTTGCLRRGYQRPTVSRTWEATTCLQHVSLLAHILPSTHMPSPVRPALRASTLGNPQRATHPSQPNTTNTCHHKRHPSLSIRRHLRLTTRHRTFKHKGNLAGRVMVRQRHRIHTSSNHRRSKWHHHPAILRNMLPNSRLQALRQTLTHHTTSEHSNQASHLKDHLLLVQRQSPVPKRVVPTLTSSSQQRLTTADPSLLNPSPPSQHHLSLTHNPCSHLSKHQHRSRHHLSNSNNRSSNIGSLRCLTRGRHRRRPSRTGLMPDTSSPSRVNSSRLCRMSRSRSSQLRRRL